MVAALEDEDILIFGLLVVKDLVDLEGHGLARPHLGGFGEPAICKGAKYIVSPSEILVKMEKIPPLEVRHVFVVQENLLTLDGGVGDFRHCSGWSISLQRGRRRLRAAQRRLDININSSEAMLRR